MKKGLISIGGFLVAALYWLFESIVHRYVFEEHAFELWPSDPNEAWMRTTIVVLIAGIGVYADYSVSVILRKEREKRAVFEATVASTMHIVNNLLNQMQFFKMKAEDSDSLDRATLALYDQTMSEGKQLVEKLGAVDEIDAERIRSSVRPGNLE